MRMSLRHARHEPGARWLECPTCPEDAVHSVTPAKDIILRWQSFDRCVTCKTVIDTTTGRAYHYDLDAHAYTDQWPEGGPA